MVLTFPIACKCISQSIAGNQCRCTDSRATAPHITVCQIDSLWLDEMVLKVSTLRCEQRSVCLALLQQCPHVACMCACRECVILWRDACVPHFSCESPWCKHRAVAALLRAYTEWQLWHFLWAARLWLPRCRQDTPPPLAAGTDLGHSASPLPTHKRWCCLLQTPDTFGFCFTKQYREKFSVGVIQYMIFFLYSTTSLWLL